MPGLTTGERAETAMHRVTGVVIDQIAGEVAGHVFDHPRRDDAHAVPHAALRHHLIEDRHRARGRVTTCARDSRAPDSGADTVGSSGHSSVCLGVYIAAAR